MLRGVSEAARLTELDVLVVCPRIRPIVALKQHDDSFPPRLLLLPLLLVVGNAKTLLHGSFLF